MKKNRKHISPRLLELESEWEGATVKQLFNFDEKKKLVAKFVLEIYVGPHAVVYMELRDSPYGKVGISWEEIQLGSC